MPAILQTYGEGRARLVLLSRVGTYLFVVASLFGSYLLVLDDDNFGFAFGWLGWTCLAAGLVAGSRLFRAFIDPEQADRDVARSKRVGPLGRSIARDLGFSAVILAVGSYIVIAAVVLTVGTPVSDAFLMPLILVPIALSAGVLGFLAWFVVGMPIGAIVYNLVEGRGFSPAYLFITLIGLSFVGYPIGVALGCDIPGHYRSAVLRGTFTALTGIEANGVTIVNEAWLWIARVSFTVGVLVVALGVTAAIAGRRQRANRLG